MSGHQMFVSVRTLYLTSVKSIKTNFCTSLQPKATSAYLTKYRKIVRNFIGEKICAELWT